MVVPVHGYDETGTVVMAGTSPAHNQIVGNLAAALHEPMSRGGCRGGVGRQRVRMEEDRYGYPDLVFVCDEPVYTDDTPEGDGEANPPVLLNPTLLIEVVSPSTVGRDRGAKLRAYAGITSLVEYWIVETEEPAISRVIRQPEGGALRFVSGLDAVLASPALDLEIALADVYRLVEFDG
ncbi:Uma2 family endonuclease [Rubrivirga sp.]|uniref:Uma2 family endonuclease n=1 Tax=Rubrivirga sp. TaxID=1885344 RepID=UPI003B522E63